MSEAPNADKAVTSALKPLGEIIEWPNGYAMSLGRDHRGFVVRCCAGHETPRAAKAHGLMLVVETVSKVADQHIADWRIPPAKSAQ